jgi:hypothetical protein
MARNIPSEQMAAPLESRTDLFVATSAMNQNELEISEERKKNE